MLLIKLLTQLLITYFYIGVKDVGKRYVSAPITR